MIDSICKIVTLRFLAGLTVASATSYQTTNIILNFYGQGPEDVGLVMCFEFSWLVRVEYLSVGKVRDPRKGGAGSFVVLGPDDGLPLRRSPQLSHLPRPSQLEGSALAGQQADGQAHRRQRRQVEVVQGSCSPQTRPQSIPAAQT